MSTGFYEGTNAPSAQKLANRAAAFKYADPLQIGSEGTPGCPQREAAIMPKGGSFPTIFTFSHDKISFSAKMLLIKTSLQHASGDFTTIRIFLQQQLLQTKEDSRHE